MEWTPSDVIALVAVVVGPLGGIAVAWYTAHRQDRAAERQDLQERRVAVEDALAHSRRAWHAAAGSTGQALIRDEDNNPAYWKRVKEIGDLVPLADAAVDALTRARVRHPDAVLGKTLDDLTREMRQLSSFAGFHAWAEANNPDDHRLESFDENFGRKIERIDQVTAAAEQRLHEYHGNP